MKKRETKSPSHLWKGLGEGLSGRIPRSVTGPPPTQRQVNDAPHRSGQAGGLTDLALASGRGEEE